MKNFFLPLAAMVISSISIAATNKKNITQDRMVFWVLKPGINHTGATVTSNYTYYSGITPPCNYTGTICGIYAKPNISGRGPDLWGTGTLLVGDLWYIKAGLHSNTSGCVFFKPWN